MAAAEREKRSPVVRAERAAYGSLDDSGKSAVERANEASTAGTTCKMNLMPGMMDTSGLGLDVRQQMALSGRIGAAGGDRCTGTGCGRECKKPWRGMRSK